MATLDVSISLSRNDLDCPLSQKVCILSQNLLHYRFSHAFLH